MNVLMWIILSLVLVVLPSVGITGGGRKRNPQALADYAERTGLPLPDQVQAPVLSRIARRERGMLIGGLAGIVAAVVLGRLAFGATDWFGLIIVGAMAGLGIGGAVAIVRNHPAVTSPGRTVARARQVELGDYLTRGEILGRNLAPVTVLLGAALGAWVITRIPTQPPVKAWIVSGIIAGVVALVLWAVNLVVGRRLLEASSRSSSDLELAWDDVERESALRMLNTATIMAAGVSLLPWLAGVMETVMGQQIWVDHPSAKPLAYLMLGGSVVAIAISAAPAVFEWATGRRQQHMFDRLWRGSDLLHTGIQGAAR